MDTERTSSKTQFKFIILIIFSIVGCSRGEGKSLSGFISPQIQAEPAMNLSQATWGIFKSLANARRGDDLKGITELKQYFLNFGYLNNPQEENITDFYDERLEFAVKLYQRNFRFPATGYLDDKTLSQIMTPRCGVPDTVDSTTNFHRIGRYAFFKNRPKWGTGKRNLTYAFSPANKQPGMNQTRLKTIFSRAFRRWAAVIPFAFRLTDDYHSADIKIGFFSGDHGDGRPFDGVLKNLAHGFCPQDGRLHFDAAESWSLNLAEDDSCDRAIDLESIAMHEIGHVLGLGHSFLKGAVMYPSIRPRTRRVFLGRDDVEGAQALYGANPRFDPSSVSLATSDEYIEYSGINKRFHGIDLFVRLGIVCLVSWGWIDSLFVNYLSF